MLQTVQKIGPLLDLFTVARPEWGVTEVAVQLGIPRSSAHALLASLVETGLLQRRSGGRYRIGWRIVELNEMLRSTVDIRAQALPLLRRLVQRHGETAHLAVMEQGRVLYLEKVIGNHVVTVRGAQIGTQLEAHCSAVGKILLASTDPRVLDRVLGNGPLRRLTASTVVDPVALQRELTAVRAAGVAYDRGEAVADVNCVAAPVTDELGSVVAAVSVTAPANRFVQRRGELTAAVSATALEIGLEIASGTPDSLSGLRDDPGLSR